MENHLELFLNNSIILKLTTEFTSLAAARPARFRLGRRDPHLGRLRPVGGGRSAGRRRRRLLPR